MNQTSSSTSNETADHKSGLDLEAYQVILRPVVTEKSMEQSQDNELNAYTFEVHQQAAKDQIRAAIEELFDVRVVAVRTQKRQGKPRRHKNRQGHTKSWKKAVVKLHEEDHITFF
ncbi:MAG TPA: 50S ribosomal protein L23 [Planctomycetaceae bacterium]|nr:50S ribosomal protein L23 [Planctomycetaceae bacterium]|tara:strand:+ start:8993 stop:9337 length:345 start_codon:yes stop_codon:yes gene_type:complete